MPPQIQVSAPPDSPAERRWNVLFVEEMLERRTRREDIYSQSKTWEGLGYQDLTPFTWLLNHVSQDVFEMLHSVFPGHVYNDGIVMDAMGNIKIAMWEWVRHRFLVHDV